MARKAGRPLIWRLLSFLGTAALACLAIVFLVASMVIDALQEITLP